MRGEIYRNREGKEQTHSLEDGIEPGPRWWKANVLGILGSLNKDDGNGNGNNDARKQ